MRSKHKLYGGVINLVIYTKYRWVMYSNILPIILSKYQKWEPQQPTVCLRGGYGGSI